ncbi:PTS sugar transporter subunit IIA [bacterium]|nr:PTS sugar transporter subunit IIA [bacterium]
MKLEQYLSEENIHLDLESADKSVFFQEALETLRKQGYVTETQRVQEDLEMREAIMSTGVGQGVAIPHALSEAVTKIHLSLWRLNKPLDFDSVDGQGVDLIFMILGPQQDSSDHVKILAGISRILHGEDFRSLVRAAGSSAEVMELLHQHHDS